MADAIVIGAGPNGLVAANLLADAGWDVLVLEAEPEPGGAVRSAELVEPGFVNDVFSAFYPLAAASPHIRALRLEEHGLRWVRAEVAVAHPAADGTCAAISLDPAGTAASLDAFAPGDGEAWRRLYGLWERAGRHALDALLTLFPPVRPALRLAAELGPAELLRFLRFATLSVRRLGEETFRGAGGRRLLAGNALHADLTPETPPGGVYGWTLCGLGQEVGFPVPQGGAGELTAALLRRLAVRGGRVVCGAPVERVVVRGARAVGVETADGERHEARRAVLADVGAPQLYWRLVGDGHLPARVLDDLVRFQYDSATVKVDWTLDGPIPWTHPDARRAGTVHVADDVDALTRQAAELACGELPARPYLVMGQYASFDPTRCPPGKETAWAYTHVPQHIAGDARGELAGRWDEQEAERFAERMEEEVERLAPGFRDRIRGRHVHTPPTLEAANRNLVGGAINGGTAQLHQQLVFRPTSQLARPETPIRRLYLASASAHPGGGVHGACGAHAARVALAAHRRRVPTVAAGALARRLQGRGR